MSELTLVLKQKWFDAILQGEKKDEHREIRPRNANRYCDFEADGKLIGPKNYDTIKFFMGYETDRPHMTVEVKSAEVVFFEDESGELITYEEDGIEYIEAEVVYQLGRLLNKHNC
ncbi:MAG TPA: ASCH domain-containing protein [Bacteroidales bacterium]|nr:ASCH domain-containing protein [Bacteroidales bacterium]